MTVLQEITAAALEHWLADQAPDCDGSIPDPAEDPCDLEAVARVEWDAECDHWPGETLQCAEHRDELREAVAERPLFRCRSCRKMARVVAIEPLR